jgi:hypothetical protein
MFRNASQAFLVLLPVMGLKSPHLVIALRNANNHEAQNALIYMMKCNAI